MAPPVRRPTPVIPARPSAPGGLDSWALLGNNRWRIEASTFGAGPGARQRRRAASFWEPTARYEELASLGKAAAASRCATGRFQDALRSFSGTLWPAGQSVRIAGPTGDPAASPIAGIYL